MKIDMTKIVNSSKQWLVKNGPTVATAVGVSGMLIATGLAVRTTPKAVDILNKYKAQHEVEKVPPVEVVKQTWKLYAPLVVLELASAACIIAAHKTDLKRNAVLATAFTLSDKTLKEYKEKVVEVVGPKKEQQVREEVAKSHLEKSPVCNFDETSVGGSGSTLCYDDYTGRYFKSSADQLNRIANDLNKRMLLDGYSGFTSLNDLYYEIDGLDECKKGNDFGWSVEDGLLEFTYTSHVTPSGVPCLVLNYDIRPRHY